MEYNNYYVMQNNQVHMHEGFRWNRVKTGGMKPGVVWMHGTHSRQEWNPFQTGVKPV